MSTFTFPTILAFGVALGLIWSVWPVSGIPVMAWLRVNAGALTLAGALIGGRAGAVLMNWPYYQQHWVEISQIWLGGMSWVGAFSGGFLALLAAARIYKHSVLKLADDLLPLFTSLVASTWLACWMTGYAYGVETQAWWGIPARDEWGLIADRWPTQLAGALAALGFHWIMDTHKARGRVRMPGLAFSFELAVFSAGMIAISRFRADPRPLWRGVPIGVWFSIGILVLSISSAVLISLRARIGSKNPPRKFRLSGKYEN